MSRAKKSVKKWLMLVSICTVGSIVCSGVAFSFFNVKDLEDRANRELQEYNVRLAKQTDAEINSYRTNLVKSIASEIETYEKNLINQSQEDVSKLEKALDEESKNRINNQLKGAQERVQKAEASADSEVDKLYKEIVNQ